MTNHVYELLRKDAGCYWFENAQWLFAEVPQQLKQEHFTLKLSVLGQIFLVVTNAGHKWQFNAIVTATE